MATTNPPKHEDIRVFIIIFDGPFIRSVCKDRVLPALKNNHPMRLMKVPRVVKAGLLPLKLSSKFSIQYFKYPFDN